MKAEAPKHSAGLVTGVGFKIMAGAGIQQIYQMGIVRLGETVNQLADQQMGIQLTPQPAQLAAGAAIQDGIGHAQRRPETP